ncbi:MAG TPA: TetR/AcrR family transcriptional regulator [Acetobacteraceae bacterium]|nr:TetR/AcrR family transcriptional regulator [Acetobacteraceae bacterium]
MSETQTSPDLADPTPKQRDIAEAATRLFMAQGYAAVSMDAIARAAGVSKATLYAYFASKDRLFASLIGTACTRTGTTSLEFSEGEVDLRGALTQLGDRMLRFMLEPQSLAIYRVVMAEAARFPELGRAFYDRGAGASRRRLAAWLEQQMQAGRLLARDPGLAAEQFVGLLRTHLHMRALLGIDPPPSDAEIETTVAAAVETFLRAYAPAA